MSGDRLFAMDPQPAPELEVDTSRHSPVCALCGNKARMWSGVTDWLVDGLWIGWCSRECRTRWFRTADDRRSATACEDDG